MAHSSLSSCENLIIDGVLDDIRCKKSGRISKLIVRTQKGIREIKASKYLRVSKGYHPKLNDRIRLKVLKKKKGDRVKLKAFEIALMQRHTKQKAKSKKPVELLICQSSSCRKRGAEKLRAKLEKELSQSSSQPCRVITSKCLGKCKLGPVAKVKSSGKVFAKLDSKRALSLVTQ